MRLRELLLISEEGKSIETATITLDLPELMAADVDSWEHFLRKLKQLSSLRQLNLPGISFENKWRMEFLLFIVFEYLKTQYVYLHPVMFQSLDKQLIKKYAKKIILFQETSTRSVPSEEVLAAYENDEQGLYIRQISFQDFVADDWLSILNNGPKTRLLSSTFVIQGVPIALIGQVPVRWNTCLSSI